MAPEEAPLPVEAEDLEAAYAYIDSLPLTSVRGLMLPTDGKSYFITWPNRDYYKRRFFESTGPKYIGATGHERPLFIANYAGGDTCVLVEGELNALSIAKACPELSVVSPGGAGDFNSKRLKRHLHSLVLFSTIIVVADDDRAGHEALILGASYLSAKGFQVRTMRMAPDANDLLCKGDEGREELRKRFSASLG